MNPLSDSRLSLCMIVRNEAATLSRCLESVRPLAPQIVVVDTGSNDSTVTIARAHGAEVIEIAWPGDFSAARNRSLEEARAPWILVLDGDEWVEPAAVNGIAALVCREPVEAFELIQRNTDTSGHAIPNAIVRLFPNRPAVRFSFPIHEEVNPSLAAAGIPVRSSTIEIAHSGYATGGEVARKAERNMRVIEAALPRVQSLNEAQHLHFHHASGLYEQQRWADAAAEFEWCFEHATAGSLTDRSGRLRAAECHLILGDPVRALRTLPADGAAPHPAALFLRARIAEAQRDADGARRAYEALLGVAPRAYAPPVSLAAIKFKALTYLAEYWRARNQMERAVKVLRMAVEISKGQRDGTAADVADAYHAIVPRDGSDVRSGRA